MVVEDPPLTLGPAPTQPPRVARDAIMARVLEASLGDARPPDKLLAGRYRLVREIGRGGLGTVWEAVLEPLGRSVAVKFLRSRAMGSHGRAQDRLLREARALAALQHEHIVTVHDVGTDDDDTPFIVMELLRGRPLSQVIRESGPLGEDVVLELGLQVCRALQEAHARGIVHRDVKPANIFVLAEAPAWHCKLLDFGLCKTLDPMTVGMTTSGMILGTPGYLAPEQAVGDRVDPRADLYGLACVLFEMLTGRPAFADPRAALILAAQLQGRSCDAEVSRGELTAGWARVIEGALKVAPDERPADAGAMAEAMTLAGHRPDLDRRLRWGGWPGRVAGGAALIGAVLSLGAWRSRSAPTPVARARTILSEPTPAPTLTPAVPSAMRRSMAASVGVAGAEPSAAAPGSSAVTPRERREPPRTSAGTAGRSRPPSGGPARSRRPARTASALLDPSSATEAPRSSGGGDDPSPIRPVASQRSSHGSPSVEPSPPPVERPARRRPWVAPGIRDPFALLPDEDE